MNQQDLITINISDIQEEIDVWNNVIPNSISFINSLYEVEVNNFYSSKFICVLNGKKNLDNSYNEFKQLIKCSIYKKKLHIYTFHRRLKIFMTDIDSCLDYLDKFCKEFRTVCDELKFSRKDKEIRSFSNEVSEIRNRILHEGIPKLEIYNSSPLVGGCGCGATGLHHFELSAKISFYPKGSTDKKSHEVPSLIKRLYENMTRIIEEIISICLKNTDLIKDKISEITSH